LESELIPRYRGPVIYRAPQPGADRQREQAVFIHLAGPIAEADADLARRRAALPDKPKPEPTPPPPDRATQKFFEEAE
jgi:hypothetical protein